MYAVREKWIISHSIRILWGSSAGSGKGFTEGAIEKRSLWVQAAENSQAGETAGEEKEPATTRRVTRPGSRE